jgi:hypothetical protein
MYNLGAAYAGVGRFKEALEVSEKTLLFRLRILPAEHPDIGESTAVFSLRHHG